ncbi:hypothetical protein [Brevibacillus daliensis]|uniref:hypothetical protein n=1 Tax=Brevibacillus daliensis TaxID=2892995 RepID=UPI001E52837F|nr:hypothetical protein [Brevibacillus daliensis]
MENETPNDSPESSKPSEQFPGEVADPGASSDTDIDVTEPTVDLAPLLEYLKTNTPTYQKETVQSGEFFLVHQVTFGDLIIAFSILLLVAVKIAKWVWGATK